MRPLLNVTWMRDPTLIMANTIEPMTTIGMIIRAMLHTPTETKITGEKMVIFTKEVQEDLSITYNLNIPDI